MKLFRKKMAAYDAEAAEINKMLDRVENGEKLILTAMDEAQTKIDTTRGAVKIPKGTAIGDRIIKCLEERIEEIHLRRAAELTKAKIDGS